MKAKYSLLNQDINTSFFNIETTWTGMRSPLVKKQIGFDVPDSFCELIKGETLNYFQNKKQAEKFSKICAYSVIHDKKLLTLIRKKTERLVKESFRLAKTNFPLPKLSDQQIIDLLIKMRDIQKNLAAWGMVVAFADIHGEISNKVTKIFSSRKGLKYPLSVYLDVLTNPSELSLSVSAYQEIFFSRDDNYLLKKYFWLDQGYIGRGLDKIQLKNIRGHNNNFTSNSFIDRIKLLAELRLTTSEKNLLQVAGEMVYLKSRRSDTRQALYVISNLIIDLLAIKWRVPVKYLEALSVLEVVSIVKNRSCLPENLICRWQRSLIIPQSSNHYRIVTDNTIDDFLNECLDFNLKARKETREIKGQVAQPGKVQGKVKLIFGPQHNNKITQGDILVSVSTSPQLLPAMKLASAFVTDMGGITSHAAIVARELKKPCIVGTKIATKVFKDGDLVEVDADKGVVRIIKRLSN